MLVLLYYDVSISCITYLLVGKINSVVTTDDNVGAGMYS